MSCFLHVRQSRVLGSQQKVKDNHGLHALTRCWLMHDNFCIILIPSFLSVNSETLTNVKETTLVTRMQTASTPLDHTYATVSLEILEMDKIA